MVFGEEPHLGFLVLSIYVVPFVDCVGFSRLDWGDLVVVLLNDTGIPIVEGVCHNTHL